jgi:hypothetical protein
VVVIHRKRWSPLTGNPGRHGPARARRPKDEREAEVRVGRPAAQRVADEESQTDDHQRPGQIQGAEPRYAFGNRRDIAIEGHEADPAEGSDRKTCEEIAVFECAKLSTDAVRRSIPSLNGNKGGNGNSGEHAEPTDKEERHVPTKRIADPRPSRDTKHVRQSQTGEHLPDGLPSEFVGNELHRHDGADAEKRPLREARDYAADEEDGVVACKGGDEVRRRS